MFEALFIDLPLALIGYALIIFILMKVQGDLVHDAEGVASRSRIDGPGSTLAREDVAKTHASRDESQHETVQIVEAVSACDPDHSVDDDHLPPHVPTDFQQRRHFITHLYTLATDVYPRPDDLEERRSYIERVQASVTRMLHDPEEVAAMEKRRLDRSNSEASFVSSAGDAQTSLQPGGHSGTIKRTGGDVLALPQDASLRRHAIQTLAAAWEKQYPRPTDPTLRRHYDQWLASEFASLSGE